MPYAVKQDIIDRYGENILFDIWDRDTTGVYDSASVDRALLDASNKIDGYIVGRYDLPLANPPAILTGCAVDMAIYLGCDESTVTEERRKRYEDCLAYLKDVARGNVSLGIEKPPSGGGGAAFSGQNRLFTRDTLKGF